MSEDVDFWIRQNQSFLDRIRTNFNKYSKESRESQEKDGEPSPNLKDLIENEWRKLNEFLSKEIPSMESKANEQELRKLSSLREAASKIQNQYIERFGALSHRELNLKKNQGLFPKQIIHSGIRNLNKLSGNSPLKEPDPIQEEEMGVEEKKNPTKSQIFRINYDKDDDEKISKFNYDFRISETEEQEVEEYKTFTSKLSSFFVVSLILLIFIVIALVSFDVEIDTGLLKRLLEL